MAKLKVIYKNNAYKIKLDDEFVDIVFNDFVITFGSITPQILIQIIKGENSGKIAVKSDFKPHECEIETELPESVYNELQRLVELP